MALPGHEPRHSLETSSDSGSRAAVGIPHATPTPPLKKWQHHGLRLGLLSSNYSAFLEPPCLSLIHDPPPLASGLAYFFLSSVQDTLGSPLLCHSMTENKFRYPTRKERVVGLEVGKSFRKCFFNPLLRKTFCKRPQKLAAMKFSTVWCGIYAILPREPWSVHKIHCSLLGSGCPQTESKQAVQKTN